MRTAILLGVAVPLAMFLLWDAAILGSVGSAADLGLSAADAAGAASPPQPCPLNS